MTAIDQMNGVAVPAAAVDNHAVKAMQDAITDLRARELHNRAQNVALRNSLKISANGFRGRLVTVPAWIGPNAGNIPNDFPRSIAALQRFGSA